MINQIKKFVRKFNPYYKRADDNRVSGTNDKDVLEAAMEEYRETIGSTFQYSHCLEILWHSPSFHYLTFKNKSINEEEVIDLDDDDDDDDDGTGIEVVEGKVNNTLSSMGSSIKRPGGIKQAKAALKDDRAYTSKSGSSMSDMVQSNQEMINTMVQRNNIFLRNANIKEREAKLKEKESKLKEMKEIRETIMMYRSLGDDEQVQFYMEKLKQVHEQADKPTVVETPNGDSLLPSSSSVTMSQTPQDPIDLNKIMGGHDDNDPAPI